MANLKISETWDGIADLANPTGLVSPNDNDDLLIAPTPEGKLYFLESAIQTNIGNSAYPFKQASFAYNKIRGGPSEVWAANLDLDCGTDIPENTQGTFVAGGGPTPTAPTGTNYSKWRAWSKPLPITQSMFLQTGGAIGVGNTAKIQLELSDGGDATEIQFMQSISNLIGRFKMTSNPVPKGSRELACFAYINANVPYSATITRASDGFVLLGVENSPANYQNSGGYSTGSCSEALHAGVVSTHWLDYVYLDAKDYILAEIVTQTKGQVGFSVFTAQKNT